MSTEKEKALEVISQLAGAPVESLTPETELVAGLGIDSPKALQLLVNLEDALDIEISDEEAAKMETVGDVLAFYDKG